MGINKTPIYLLGDTPHKEVSHLPLFEIIYTPFEFDEKNFDAIIFTSKNSVKALELCSYDWKNKASYAIGEATARAILNAGGRLVYTSANSYGEFFAQEMVPYLKNQKVFFPRAKEVVSSVYEILKDAGISITQAVVYENRCKCYERSKSPEKRAILIFTSPSSVKCFERNFSWDESYVLIAIGQKTAEALPKEFKIFLPNKQTIEACICLAKEIRS